MKAAIFDLDGTLLDTLGDIGGACNRALKKFGLAEWPVSAYKKMVGNGFDVLVRRAAGPAVENLAEINALAREEYANNMTSDTRIYPGMREALLALKEAGVWLAAYSNKPDAMCRVIIPHYYHDIPFQEIVGAREDAPLKPDPTVLLTMLERNGIKREDAFYIGDSDVDMITAKNAGARGIGAGWGFRGETELIAAGAWKTLTNPGELPGVIISA